ncbi:MAG: 30S ribosomal protein S6 [Candidatus Liptonbacteria bacterium]|nr:30S ribosomal protein S6 [Candidatus Liptonbacteria bacterium]
MDQSEKQRYEVAFLAQSEEGGKAVEQLLRQHGGELLFQSPLERLQLAYAIRKEREAYFGYSHVALPAAAAQSLRDGLQGEEGILRYLVITPPFVRAAAGRTRTSVRTREAPVRHQVPLSNEDLEKKIGEILQ